MIWDNVQQASTNASALDRAVLELEQSNETARLRLNQRTNESLSVDDFAELLPSGD
jgi:hypothetical protein